MALITSTPDEVNSLLDTYSKEQEHIHMQIINICANMDGGIGWDDAWALSYIDRARIITYLEKRAQQRTGIEYL